MVSRVLITGARAAVSLDLARDFTAAGWEVHLADSVVVRMARWSKVPARHYLYPAPRLQSQAFRTWIAHFVTDKDIDLIVPTCEEVFYLAAPSLHRQLGKRLLAPDLATLRTLHDKFAFAHACTQWGFNTPESHTIESEETLAGFAASSEDWVFKPRFSRFGDRTLIAPQPIELKGLMPNPGAGWMAQRYIRGEEACFYAVAYHGKLVGFAAYCSDWRLGGGARYAFESLPAEKFETLRKIAGRLAECAQVHGQFACDVMFDSAGSPYLLECNPRATSGVHLLTGNGELASAISAGKSISEDAQRSAYLAPAMWLFGLPLAIRTLRLAGWRTCLENGSDAISRNNDRAPIAGALADAACFFLKGLRHNISTNGATTFDIEWNGEERDE